MSGKPRKLTRHTMARHVKALTKQCAYMAHAFEIGGMPAARNREGGFRTLLRIIVDQQISVQAGAAIWAKLENRLGVVTAPRFLAVREPTLRKCGLSAQKVRYGRELARAIHSGSLDLEGLDKLDDQAVTAELTAIKGIGIWTAEIYLMFAMGRPDVMPAGDLALQVAAGNLMGLKKRPNIKELRTLAERWAPYRTAAAIMLWQFYRKMPLMESGDG